MSEGQKRGFQCVEQTIIRNKDLLYSGTGRGSGAGREGSEATGEPGDSDYGTGALSNGLKPGCWDHRQRFKVAQLFAAGKLHSLSTPEFPLIKWKNNSSGPGLS